MTEPLRACAICVKAKVRCISTETEEKCERCQRLNKSCESRESRAISRKKKPAKYIRVPRNRVAKLEEKVDQLVSILGPARHNTSEPEMSVSSQPRRRLGPDVGATTLPNHAASRGILVEQHEQNSNHDVLPGSLLQPSNDTIRSESRDTSHPGPFHMHNTEAAANLAFFRDEMSQTFPFFVLLPTTVPEELLSFRPITFWAIMAVSSRKYMAQVAIREWLSRELSDRVSMKGERSIDLLLGTLIYTAWSAQLYLGKHAQVTGLIMTAMTLVYDLGLHRPPPQEPPNRTAFENCVRNPSNAPFQLVVRSAEEKRALLGVFLLSSIVSGFLRRIDPLRLTAYIQDCCEFLRASPEHPQDLIASRLISLQIIAERMSQTTWQDGVYLAEFAAPRKFYIKAIQEHLYRFRAASTPEHEHNPILLMHYHFIEMSLYDPGSFKPSKHAHSGDLDLEFMETLYGCLQAMKSLLDTLFGLSTVTFSVLPISIWSHVTSCLFSVQKLSAVEHPDWDKNYAGEIINFSELLDKFLNHLQQAKEGLDLGSQDGESTDVFTRSVKQLEHIKVVLGTRGARESQEQQPPSMEEDLCMQAADYGSLFDNSWLWDDWGFWDLQQNTG